MPSKIFITFITRFIKQWLLIFIVIIMTYILEVVLPLHYRSIHWVGGSFPPHQLHPTSPAQPFPTCSERWLLSRSQTSRRRAKGEERQSRSLPAGFSRANRAPKACLATLRAWMAGALWPAIFEGLFRLFYGSPALITAPVARRKIHWWIVTTKK